MIAIEGPDGAGKTTFLSALLNRRPELNVPVWHSGGPVISTADFRAREAFVLKHPQLVIDRLPYISELVYCHVTLRTYPVPEQELWDGVLRVDPIVVYCRLARVDDMLDRILEGKPHKPPEWYAQVRERFPRIVERYDSVMQQLVEDGVRVLRFNWQTQDTSVIADQVWSLYEES